MNRPAWFRGIAGLLSVMLMGGTGAFASPAPASLQGTVTVQGGTQPIAGAVVLVGNPKDGSVVPSGPADAEGRFSIGNLAPATYQLAVREGEKLWVVDAPVTLAPGQVRDVTVGINPQQAPGPDTAAAEADKDKMTFWNNPLTASLIVVGAAVLVGFAIDAATDDDDPTPVSPSN
ncbi:MAG TPA: carboxypeptidase-like regulatory domain-containing protein [Candidatus Polarisedimenticolaceae bacterium]